MDRAEISVMSVPATGNASATPTVVVAQGEYDLSNAADLLATLTRAIVHNDATVILDLGGVTFMDASTLRVIARASELLEARARTFVLREPSTFAHRILDICGLAHLVELETPRVVIRASAV